MELAVAAALSVAVVSLSALKGLQMLFAHRERKFVHEPLHLMQKKLDEMESRLLGQAMRR